MQCVNTTSQQIAYDALFTVFSQQPWFAGVYIWLWRPDPSSGGTCDTDYTPQSKAASATLKHHWASTVPHRAARSLQIRRDATGRVQDALKEIAEPEVLVSRTDPYSDRIKGVIVGSGEWSSHENNRLDTPSAEVTLRRIAATGANSVQAAVTWFFASPDDTSFYPIYSNATPYRSESDAELTTFFRTARGMGFKTGLSILLDPDFRMANYSARNIKNACWRDFVGRNFTEDQWDAWFRNYEAWAVHYAKLSQQNGVELFIVENELMTVLNHPSNGDRWRRVVNNVKSVFKGMVTAKQLFNSMGNPPHPFTDLMDILGFGCYHDFVNTSDAFPDPYRVPSVAALEKGWAASVQGMELLHNLTGKKVMCIEVGIQSRPWSWTWRHPGWAGGDNDPNIAGYGSPAGRDIQADEREYAPTDGTGSSSLPGNPGSLPHRPPPTNTHTVVISHSLLTGSSCAVLLGNRHPY